MMKDLRGYAVAVGQQYWLLLSSGMVVVIMGLISTAADYDFPFYIWIVTLFGLASVAQFRAWSKLRRESAELKELYALRNEPKSAIVLPTSENLREAKEAFLSHSDGPRNSQMTTISGFKVYRWRPWFFAGFGYFFLALSLLALLLSRMS